MTTSDTAATGSVPREAPEDFARPSRGARASAAFARIPRWVRLAAVAALALRLVVMLTYSTAVLGYYGGDSARYLRLVSSGHVALFSDPAMPAGYPTFLLALRTITDSLSVTIGLQHLLGIATGLLAYVAVRQTRAPAWVAAVPALVVWFSGDQIFLEHALLTETPWVLLLFGGLAAAMHGMRREHLGWFAVASVLIGASALVRHLSLLVPAILAVWALTLPGTPRRRVVRAGCAIVPAVGVVLAYMLTASLADGRAGIGDMSGFSLYARVGQFADCREFTPPEGTRGLCETTPVDQRPGPYGYSYGADSPLYRAGFGATPEDADTLGTFARAAILHQPIDYARTAGKDFLRYFDPRVGDNRAGIGASPDQMSFGQRTPIQQGASLDATAEQFERKYDGVDADTAGTGALVLLETYQAVFRIGGLVLLASLLITALGLWRGRGAVRAGIGLFGAVAVYLLVAPPALSSYDARYAVAPGQLLAASAALGVWALVQHRAAKVRLPGPRGA